MRAVSRLAFQPAARVPARPTLIDRYLSRDDHARHGRWAAAPAATGLAGVRLALHDTGGKPATIETPPDAATIWHVLWVRDEARSRVVVGDATWPVAPGDSVVVPPGMPLRVEGRQLAVAIEVPGAVPPLEPPTHGEERFFGYNRQTVCCRAGDIRLCRWKLTQPLALARHHPEPTLVLALARDSVMRTASTVDRLRQGELAVPDPAAIVTPDGLSYLLAIDRDAPTR
jgi:hypothetical protein